MVSAYDILTEINRMLAEKFIGVPIYINYCPINFQRPSFLIRCQNIKREDASRYTVQVTVNFSVTCFLSVDEYRHSNTVELAAKQYAVMELFDKSYIAVGDRAVKVNTTMGSANDDNFNGSFVASGDGASVLKNTGPESFDSAVINIQFQFFDDRSEINETAELMGTLMTNTNLH